MGAKLVVLMAVAGVFGGLHLPEARAAAYFDQSQTMDVVATYWWQVLGINYANSETDASQVRYLSGELSIRPPNNSFFGMFVYDFATGEFDGSYFCLNQP